MQKSFASGPFPVGNSEKYYNIYQYGGENHYKMKFYQKPDSSKYPLLNDLQETVDLSTFLSDGRILLKSGYRFYIFDKDGNFIDEIDFTDVETNYQKIKKNGLNRGLTLKNHVITGINESSVVDAEEQKENQIFNTLANEVSTRSVIPNHERMVLLNMSSCN